jgi:hypothetical protein
LGAIGLSRFMLPLVSPRARVVATICYLGLPLPYAALGAGRWDGLVAYAAFPFIVARLARASGIAPFDQIEGHGWRATPTGQIALLGAIMAAACSFAPAVLPMTVVCALALVVGSALVGSSGRARRVFGVTVKAIAVALVLNAPWVVGVLLSGSHAVDIFGLPVSASAVPSWGEVVRFAVGPTARSPVVWLLVAAAALPLLLGTGTRLAWAARLWVMACGSWVLAVVTTRGWTGAFTPSESVVLVPAAVAVAAAIGLGISAFENDLSGRSFGWRQVVSVAALGAVIVGLLPVAAGALEGRWDMPANGAEQPLGFLNRPAPGGAFRVLWLGDPRALPVGGWSVEPGLSYALTDGGLPDSASVWTPAGPGPADLVADAVHLAITGGTVHLGRLLAAQSVRYVVVVEGLDSSDATLPASVAAPPPVGLQRALLNQDDLQIEPGEFGVQVYRNPSALPLTAQRSQALPASTVRSAPGAADVAGWQPVLAALALPHGGTGTVRQSTVFSGYAPAGRFSLTVHGRSVARRPAFGWAGQYPGAPAGPARLSFSGPPYVPAAVLLELLAWAALAAALAGWRRWPLQRLGWEGDQ